MHGEIPVHNELVQFFIHTRKRAHIVWIWTHANVCEDVDFTQNTTTVSYTKCQIILLYAKETDLYMFVGRKSLTEKSYKNK